MAVYPQLTTGALVQYPIRKRQTTRTVTNITADGRSIRLADQPASLTEWHLRYEGLSDVELYNLEQFFVAVEGSLNGFTFIDPAGNLLAWSEDLGNAAWTQDPFLTITAGTTDPLGGKNAFRLTNSGEGAQGLSQILNAPTSYTYSFSCYIRTDQPASVTLVLGSHRASAQAGPDWTRISITGSGDEAAASILFGVELSTGAIDLFGPQAEAQHSPSAYQKSTTGGVYSNSRFSDDGFSFTSTGVNQHRATVNITHVNHL